MPLLRLVNALNQPSARDYAQSDPNSWPAFIASTDDLLKLITALLASDRSWHFDDDPSDVVHSINGLLLIKTFTVAECALLLKLRADCEPFGGVWKMMEDEPSQACHKLLGIAAPVEGGAS